MIKKKVIICFIKTKGSFKNHTSSSFGLISIFWLFSPRAVPKNKKIIFKKVSQFKWNQQFPKADSWHLNLQNKQRNKTPKEAFCLTSSSPLWSSSSSSSSLSSSSSSSSLSPSPRKSSSGYKHIKEILNYSYHHLNEIKTALTTLLETLDANIILLFQWFKFLCHLVYNTKKVLFFTLMKERIFLASSTLLLLSENVDPF